MVDFKELWLEILQDIYPKFNRSFFITYFKNSAILWIEDWKLIIWVPRPMYLNWHLEHSSDIIFESVKKINPKINDLIFNIDWTLENDDLRAVSILAHFPSRWKKRKLPWKQQVKLIDGITSKILNPKYRLNNFVVWSSSSMAHAASTAVAKKPGWKYNPFFLYWDTWLWKTHILQAIWNEIILDNPEAVVVYIGSETFTNEVVEWIKKQNMDKIRKKYRQVDVFIIDDIQFIAWKERTMEEFFHTFNTLYEAEKQIVIAADRPPKELQSMEKRLVSRFESWMTADIKMPDYETKLAILHTKAQNCYSMIPSDVFEFIALNVDSSVRELEWVLMQVVASIELENRIPTLQDIWNHIKEINKDKKLVWYDQEKPVLVKSIDDVITYTANYFNLTVTELVWPKRTKDIMYPRQLAMYISRENLHQWLSKIGEDFWWRDHTSVMHSIKKIEEQLKSDPVVKKDIKLLYKEMWIM